MHATSSQVQGKAYDNVVPTPESWTAAVLDMQAAHLDAGGRLTADLARINSSGLIGGESLIPGVHDFKIGHHYRLRHLPRRWP
jgi:hypothetical protein